MSRLWKKMRTDLTAAYRSGAMDYYDPAIKVYAVSIDQPEVIATEPATAKELQVLKRLELLSGDGNGDYGMIARKHLKASAETMQVLWFKGLVDGRGLPDKHGVGNTPDSSIWGITKLGRKTLAAASMVQVPEQKK